MAERRPLPLWLLGLATIVAVGFTAIEAIAFVAMTRPLHAVTGRLVRLERSGGGRGEDDFRFTLSDGRSFEWRCNTRACRGKEPGLLDLRWNLPQDAKLDLAGNQVVGALVGGAQVLDPELERGSQTLARFGEVALGVLVSAACALATYARMWQLGWFPRSARA